MVVKNELKLRKIKPPKWCIYMYDCLYTSLELPFWAVKLKTKTGPIIVYRANLLLLVTDTSSFYILGFNVGLLKISIVIIFL